MKSFSCLVVAALLLFGCQAKQAESIFEIDIPPGPTGWTGPPTEEQKARTFQGRGSVSEFPTMSEVLERERESK